MVGDLDTGVQMLMNGKLDYTVTGSVVNYCEAIDFVSARAGI